MSTKSSAVVRATARKPTKPGVMTFKVSIAKKKMRLAPARKQLMQALVTHAAELPEREISIVLKKLRSEGLWKLAEKNPRTPSSGTMSNEAALERAFARADIAQANLAKRSDMLTGEQIATKLGLSRATVDNRRVAGRMLAVDLGTKRGVRYPDWQAEWLADATRRAAFESTLHALGEVGASSKYRFFTQVAPALGGRTPAEALNAGDAHDVIQVAKIWGSGEQGGA